MNALDFPCDIDEKTVKKRVFWNFHCVAPGLEIFEFNFWWSKVVVGVQKIFWWKIYSMGPLWPIFRVFGNVVPEKKNDNQKNSFLDSFLASLVTGRGRWTNGPRLPHFFYLQKLLKQLVWKSKNRGISLILTRHTLSQNYFITSD